MIQELATLYLKALGYESINSVSEEVADGLNVPIFHEVTKANGAPLLWAFYLLQQNVMTIFFRGIFLKRVMMRMKWCIC